MLNIERALNNSQILRSLTGLTPKQFAELLPRFAAELARQKKAARRKRNPQRAEGGGRHHTLDTAEAKLFFILLYLRIYPTMEVAAFLFDVVRSVICDWVKELLPVLEKTLGATQDLPQRKIRSVDEFLEKFPEVKRVIIDSTERPRTRPKDPKKQKSEYSGKKKRHTMKNTILVDPTSRRMLIVGKTVPGPTNDNTDAKPIVKQIPGHIPIDGDLAYEGVANTYIEIFIPQKKPRLAELSDEQKTANQEFSKRRVIVEHCIGRVKRYRCVSDVFRNRREQSGDLMMVVCCGLSNYYQRSSVRA
jgi:hypothetical protein